MARLITWERVALGGLVLAIGAVVAYYGQRYHLRQPDELLTVRDARFLGDDFPTGLWDTDAFDRGPERLTAVLLLLVNGFVHSTASQFAVGHVIVALVWALAAVPTYLLARGVGLGTPWALAIAALALLNPWAVSAVTYLNAAAGFTTFMWLLYAMWRATVRPSTLVDVGVLIAFTFAVLARVGHAPFVLALAAAIVVQSWRDRPPRQPFRRWLSRLPGTIARERPVLAVAGALVIVIVVLVGKRGIVGDYGSEVDRTLDLSALWLKVRVVTSRVAEGIAFIPLLLALPWLVRELVRPRRPETGALAVLTVAIFALFFYVFLGYPMNDRYAVILLPPILIAFGCALTRVDVSWLAVAVVGALVARAVATVGIYPTDEPFSYFNAGGSQFFKRVILNKLAAVLPFADEHVLTIALVLAVVAAVVLVWLVRRPGRLATAAAVAGIAAVFGYSAVGAGYVTEKFLDQTGASDLTFAQQTYVDRVAGDEPVGLLGGPADPGLETRWSDASYFNGALAMSVGRDDARARVCCSRRREPAVSFTIDESKGLVRVTHGTMPRLLLAPTGWLPYGLNGRPIVTGYDLMRLERLPSRVQASFVTQGGTHPDGWGKPGEVQRLRVFPAVAGAGKAACLAGAVGVPVPTAGKAVHFTLRSGLERVARNVPPGQAVPVRLRLANRSADQVRLFARRFGVLPDGRRIGVRLTDVHVGPCTRPGTAVAGASGPA